MTRPGDYPTSIIARRIAVRTVRHLVRDPIVLLGLTCLMALLLVGWPGTWSSDAAQIGEAPPAPQSDDAADRYMRGLLTRDVAEVFGSLSPDMRRSLEQRTGLVGASAVSALFQEQDRRGERTVGYRLVASYRTVQGDEVRFYVVQARRGSEQREIPYLLTLAPDGSVAKIE